METGRVKRRNRLMAVADTLVEKVADAAGRAESASELKQLTGALKELKDIQDLREQLEPQGVQVVLDGGVEEMAE